jgi:hypothetical protein
MLRSMCRKLVVGCSLVIVAVSSSSVAVAQSPVYQAPSLQNATHPGIVPGRVIVGMYKNASSASRGSLRGRSEWDLGPKLEIPVTSME